MDKDFIEMPTRLSGAELVDLGLYFKEKKLLIISDVHIGYEESMNKQGVLVPRFQFKDVIQRLEKIFEKTMPEKVIINGDIKHEFGRISDQEWRETLKLIDFILQNAKKLILIKGNHDTILGPIADKANVEIKEKLTFTAGSRKFLVIHGHKIPNRTPNCDTIIIGHEHPCVSIQEEARTEKFKCFLVGKWKNKQLIVLPSFNLVTEGTDVLKEKLLSPFLIKADLQNFDAFVVSDDVYHFGKLKNLIT